MAPEETGQAILLKRLLDLSEIQHMLLWTRWKERPVAQSGRNEHPLCPLSARRLKKQVATALVPLTCLYYTSMIGTTYM